MNCELIQPNLLDYSKQLLTAQESKEIAAHIKGCPECAALLKEEIAFDRVLAAVPDEQPANDVWALVRAATKPSRFGFVAFTRNMLEARVRRLAVGAAALVVVGCVFLAAKPTPVMAPAVAVAPAPAPAPPANSNNVAVAVSDEPLSKHTDAMLDVIEKM